MHAPCRVYGWAVWGKVKDNHPTYQMFSTPVTLKDPHYCHQSYAGEASGGANIRRTDLCIDNAYGKMCPKVNSDHFFAISKKIGLFSEYGWGSNCL